MILTQNKQRNIISSLILWQILALLPATALAKPLACGSPQSYASGLVSDLNERIPVAVQSVGTSQLRVVRNNNSGARYDFDIIYDAASSRLSDVIIDFYFRGGSLNPPANEVLYADLYRATQEFGIDIPGSRGAISVPEKITFKTTVNDETEDIHHDSSNAGKDLYTVYKGDELFDLYMNTSGTLAKSAARTIQKANEFYSDGAWTITSLVVELSDIYITSFQLNIEWVSASTGT